jgi:hypothetical protein
MIEIIGEPRDATKEEIRNYKQKCQELDQQTEEQKQAWKEKHPDPQSPEWHQRMMDNFLRRPKCRPDCFGAAAGDCKRCG